MKVQTIAGSRVARVLGILVTGMLLTACGDLPAMSGPMPIPSAKAQEATPALNTPDVDEAAGKIALLLPQTKTARYESQDLPHFKATLQRLGFNPANLIYSNANPDTRTQRAQAEAALTNGARVRVLDPVDSNAPVLRDDLPHHRSVLLPIA